MARLSLLLFIVGRIATNGNRRPKVNAFVAIA
jgi:hypothetical protein